VLNSIETAAGDQCVPLDVGPLRASQPFLVIINPIVSPRPGRMGIPGPESPNGAPVLPSARALACLELQGNGSHELSPSHMGRTASLARPRGSVGVPAGSGQRPGSRGIRPSR
jgi:hypothetical protein